MLEKRVKSRYSNRQINLWAGDTFGDFLKVLQAKLHIPENLTLSSYAKDFNANIQDTLLTTPSFLEITRRTYDFTKDFRVIFQCLAYAASLLTRGNPFLQADKIQKQFLAQSLDSKVRLLMRKEVH